MFLLRKKIRGRSIINPLGRVDLPPAITDEESEAIVPRLRAGTATTAEKTRLCEGHIRLAVQIAGRYANQAPTKIPDLVGEAMLAIGLAIRDAPARLTDDNFTPYCVGRIHGAVYRFIKEDHLTQVPATTIARKKEAGVEVKVPLVFGGAFYSEKEIQETDESITRSRRRYHQHRKLVVNPRRCRVADIKEMISQSIRSAEERVVIELREQGFKDVEIAEKLNCSKSLVNMLRSRVAQRFEQLEAEDA